MPKTKKRKRTRSPATAQKARQSLDSAALDRSPAATPRGSDTGRNVKADRPLIPKQELAEEIATIIRYHHLTQTEAARIVGDAAPQMSLLLSGRIDGFSTERLLRMLLRLGRDIELVFKPASNPRGARFRITHKSTLGAAL